MECRLPANGCSDARVIPVADYMLVEGDLTTGSHVRHVVYNRRTRVFHALTDDPVSNASIRENAK
jgi:hypothetical protein